jgi:catechol 2,3-dioxygenase-like lactoylglutathione lyase family enzyme
MSEAAFRLELFVKDVASSVDFYTRVLGFTAGESHADGYVPLTKGTLRLSLNRRAALPEDHPIYQAPQERAGRGIELVLEVDDVTALCEQVLDQGWPLSDTLAQRPWGLTDFRILDPDGYYWRITSRS